MRIIRKTWEVEGVLTDVTTAKLSDPTGTYGIKRTVAGDVEVADGTAMTHSGTGIYTYEFDEPVATIAYTAYVEFVYDGLTYHFEVDIPAGGSDSGFLYTYDDLREEVADFLGWRRSSGNWSSNEASRIDAIIKAGLLRVYYPERVGKEFVHQWSWMRPVVSIDTVEPYDTGTVEIVSGVVTLTSGTWPSWAASGELTISGGTYSVNTRDSNSQITLDDTSVDADAETEYTLSQATYDLESTFGGAFDGPLTFAAGSTIIYRPIPVVSHKQVRDERQSFLTTGTPTMAAVHPKTFVATTGQRWQITFYPTPDAVYQLSARSKVSPSMLDATNKYPLGGSEIAELILTSCLAIAEQRYRDEQGVHRQEFPLLLAAAIANDADAFSPNTLGYNADRSDNRVLADPFYVPSNLYPHIDGELIQ